jgi:hypothetical protein
MQAAVLDQQVAAFVNRARCCPQCGRERNIKDYRTRLLRTLYGDLSLRLPRLKACGCVVGNKNLSIGNVWLGKRLLPNQSTPELIATEAAIGSSMTYRQAAHMLNCFIPTHRKRHHTTVRNHTLRVGERLDLTVRSYPQSLSSTRLRRADVAIDATYTRGRIGEHASRIPIIAGRFSGSHSHIVTNTAIFAFVQQHQPDRERLTQMWRDFGCNDSTRLRLVTDGDRGLEHLVRRSAPGHVKHILDWFHIAMKLRPLHLSLSTCLHCLHFGESNVALAQRALLSIRWNIWHGRIKKACTLLAELVVAIRYSVQTNGCQWSSLLESHLTRMKELREYLRKYQEGTVNYGKELRKGELVSTAPVESLMNSLINRRMNKRQQMSWSSWGAHCLLQVRVACVNRVYGNVFAEWYPGFGKADPNLRLALPSW